MSARYARHNQTREDAGSPRTSRSSLAPPIGSPSPSRACESKLTQLSIPPITTHHSGCLSFVTDPLHQYPQKTGTTDPTAPLHLHTIVEACTLTVLRPAVCFPVLECSVPHQIYSAPHGKSADTAAGWRSGTSYATRLETCRGGNITDAPGARIAATYYYHSPAVKKAQKAPLISSMGHPCTTPDPSFHLTRE